MSEAPEGQSAIPKEDQQKPKAKTNPVPVAKKKENRARKAMARKIMDLIFRVGIYVVNPMLSVGVTYYYFALQNND